MAFPATLIDFQDLVETCAIGTELDAQYVRPSITNAESKQIVGIIGDPYYEYLLSAKQSNALLPQDVLVLSKMKACLAYWACAELAKARSYPLTNKGVVERLDATSKRTTTGSIADRIMDWTQDAEHYAAQFIKWFIKYVADNPSLFPLVNLNQCPSCCANSNYGFTTGIMAMPRSADMKGWNLPNIRYGY